MKHENRLSRISQITEKQYIKMKPLALRIRLLAALGAIILLASGTPAHAVLLEPCVNAYPAMPVIKASPCREGQLVKAVWKDGRALPAVDLPEVVVAPGPADEISRDRALHAATRTKPAAIACEQLHPVTGAPGRWIVRATLPEVLVRAEPLRSDDKQACCAPSPRPAQANAWLPVYVLAFIHLLGLCRMA